MTTAFISTAATLITADMGWAYRRRLATITRMAEEMQPNLDGAEIWHADGLRLQIDVCCQMVFVIDPANYTARDAHLIDVDRAISADWQALADIAAARVAEIEAAIAAR